MAKYISNLSMAAVSIILISMLAAGGMQPAALMTIGVIFAGALIVGNVFGDALVRHANKIVDTLGGSRMRGMSVTALALFGALMASTQAAFAQTPVPIVVDTNAIFTQTNNWISVFAPIVAIGVGIAIALAILTFIGNQILKAFRSSGR